jgi:hypothetical protein
MASRRKRKDPLGRPSAADIRRAGREVLARLLEPLRLYPPGHVLAADIEAAEAFVARHLDHGAKSVRELVGTVSTVVLQALMSGSVKKCSRPGAAAVARGIATAPPKKRTRKREPAAATPEVIIIDGEPRSFRRVAAPRALPPAPPASPTRKKGSKRGGGGGGKRGGKQGKLPL